METCKMKVSEWLSQFSGHDACELTGAKADFEKYTGKVWPSYLNGQFAKRLLNDGRVDPKGLQAWNGEHDDLVLAGWQIASALAKEYAGGFTSKMYGRGSEFRDCVQALRLAGQ